MYDCSHVLRAERKKLIKTSFFGRRENADAQTGLARAYARASQRQISFVHHDRVSDESSIT